LPILFLFQWAEGCDSQYPESDPVSSFSALDALLLHYSDRERFPSLEQVVFGKFIAKPHFSIQNFLLILESYF